MSFHRTTNNNYPNILGRSLQSCFIFYHLFVIVSHVNVLAVNIKDLDDDLNSKILKDQFCSDIIDNNPCAKDMLKLFVNQINENRNEINKNRNEIELLKQRLEKYEKIDLSGKSSPITDAFSSLSNYDMNRKHTVNDHAKDENVHDSNNPIYKPNSNEKLDIPTKYIENENNKIGYWKNIGQVLDEHLLKTQIDYMDDDNELEDSSRGFSPKSFPYRYDRFSHNTYNRSSTSKRKSSGILRRVESNDQTWSLSNLGNFILKSVQWGRLGEQIDHHLEISNRQLNLGGLINPGFLSLAAPAASIGLGAFNTIQNAAQQQTIEDRVKDVEDLQSKAIDLEAKIAAIPITDISDLEEKVEHILGSLNNICNLLEQVSKDSATSTNDIQHCCINKDLGKMNCARNSFIVGGVFAGTGGIEISNTLAGVCGRCSTGENGDPNNCDTDYTGGYCDA